MKKFISVLTLVAFLALLIAPVALAQTPPTEVVGCTMRHTLTGFTGFYCPDVDTVCNFSTPGTCGTSTCTCGACCLLDTIYTITDWIFYIVIAVALIFIILGAMSIITAGGSPEKVQTGRNYILYAVIGLIVALAAKAIPSLARAIIGV
jgi:hypothetical protein